MRKEIIGNSTLYLGDCFEVMQTIERVDAIITDPPYDEKTHNGADKKFSDINFAPLESPALLAKTLLEKSRFWVLAFCSFEQLGQYRDGAGEAWIRAGIWDKITNMPQMTGDRPAQGGEAIAIMHNKGMKKWNGGGRAAIYRHLVERDNKQHPTQKPLALIEELISLYTNEGQTVLDPFMGSGTTGVACMRLGRKFMGIEIDPKYFDIACRRIEAETKQMKFDFEEAQNGDN